MNKSDNPPRHPTPLKTVALAATFAVLFWLFQANAYPLHNGEYLFWPEMPKASRVLADMKGTNDFDTAVRQTAALGLLRDLVSVDMDGKGLRYAPARENELDTAYIHALPKGNGNVYEISAKALRLKTDPSFVESFLKSYFSEAAVREIEPVLPSFEADALKNVPQVEALAKREAASAPIQTEAQKEAQKKIAQDAAQSGLTVAQFDYYLAAFMALCLIFIIIWLVWLFGACVPIRMTSDDPPQFKGRLNRLKVYTFTGYVRGSATRSDTSVSGSISTAGNRVQGSISSKTTVTNTFRLVDPRNKEEQNFAVQNFHVRIFEDQLVSVAWVIRKNRKDGPVFIVVNHTTEEPFLSNTVWWNKFTILDTLFVLITIFIGVFTCAFWSSIIGIIIAPLPMIWIILVKIQVKRFNSSGVQPLVEALNRKAKELA